MAARIQSGSRLFQDVLAALAALSRCSSSERRWRAGSCPGDTQCRPVRARPIRNGKALFCCAFLASLAAAPALKAGCVFTTVDYPGAPISAIFGIISNGMLAGTYANSTAGPFQGFASLVPGLFATVDFPGAPSTMAWGINASGNIVGTYYDAGGNSHGFTYDGTNYNAINYAGTGVTGTQLNGINNNNTLMGGYDSTGPTGGLRGGTSIHRETTTGSRQTRLPSRPASRWRPWGFYPPRRCAGSVVDFEGG